MRDREFETREMSSHKKPAAGCSQASPPPKKGKWYKQNFREAWLSDPELKDWVARDANDSLAAICTVCNCKLLDANKTGLLRHRKSNKHASNFSAKQKTLTIGDCFKRPTGTDPAEKADATAEALFVAFMAEHKTPFLQADHLTGVMKRMFPDSKIAQRMKMKRSKASYVM